MRWALVFFFIAVFLIPIGVIAIVKDQPYSANYSFTVPPGQYIYLPLHVSNGGRISGDFVEISGQPVTVYVFNQQEYDEYVANSAPSSLFSAMDLSQGPYSASIPAPGTYYVVTAHGTGYEQTSEPVTLSVKVDGTNLPYLGLESLAPVGGGLLVFAYVMRRRQNRLWIAAKLKEIPNFGLGQGEEDSRILAIAKELCQQLRLVYDPIAVYWIVWIRVGGLRVAPSDQCLLGVKGRGLGRVQFSAALRGRLGPDELRPLIASALMWNLQPELIRRRRAVNRRWLLTIPVWLALGLLYFWFFQTFIPVNSPEEFLLATPPFFLGLFVVTLPIFLSARKVNLAFRKYFLEADRLAAEVVGRTQMLQTLGKIDSMRLADVEERKKEKLTVWKRGGVFPWPSLTERIQNLETVPLQP
jgi:hypothetical protein